MNRQGTGELATDAAGRRGRWLGAAMAVVLALCGSVQAQRGNAQPPAAARAAAPMDLTGDWVSLVTQDWRWRMVTPPKGDYRGIPLTAEALKAAAGWDPARDEAAGEQCRSYGAPALMSVPGRVRISWQDADTLKVETDAGMQTRLLRFAPAAGRHAARRGAGKGTRRRSGSWRAATCR